MGHITAEKQSPSAIQFYADLKEAIALERRVQQGNKPLKNVLSKIVADYNRMVTVRSHRIDTNRRNMAYNLLLSRIKSFCLTLLLVERGIDLGLGGGCGI